MTCPRSLSSCGQCPPTLAPPHPIFLLCFVYYNGCTASSLSSSVSSGQTGGLAASLLTWHSGCKVTWAGGCECYLKNYKVQYKKLKIAMKLILYLYWLTESARGLTSWWQRPQRLRTQLSPITDQLKLYTDMAQQLLHLSLAWRETDLLSQSELFHFL